MSDPARSHPVRGLLAATWLAVGVVVAGIILDFRWHRIHDSADSAMDLVVSHWLIWLGLVLVIVVGAVGARRYPSTWYSGWRFLLLGGAAYASFELFHVWSHEVGRAEGFATGLAQAGKAVVLLGAITATAHARGRRRAAASPSAPPARGT